VLKAIGEVQFIPENQANRMRPMIEGRSDWCISRQRNWGVPIPAFYHKETGEALLTPEVIKHVKGIVSEKGTNAWFELSVAELLPEEHRGDAESYEKGTDTMDVWFDSGSSWAYVKEILGAPVDLYLEGSDQHRGWFQSSLITSVAAQGHAPYKSVMTHGFCVDENGRKMSKSVGNVIDPRDIIEGGKNPKTQPALGADTLRWWACGVDFSSDVSISQAILATCASDVTRIRNRARFLLGNISDFNASSDSVVYDDLAVVDKYIISKAEAVFVQVEKDYSSYNFASATKALDRFISQELSALYLDLAKDRLYIEAKDSQIRRSSQTVLRWLLISSAQVMSPVLCHLAEDIWQFLPGEKEPSVFLSGWWKKFPGRPDEAQQIIADFARALDARNPVNLALEKARAQKLLGGGVEARAVLTVVEGSEMHSALSAIASSPHQAADGLKILMGVSELELVPVQTLPDVEESEEAVLPVQQRSEELGVVATLTRADGLKCERCWIRCKTVGASAAHPTLCSRCVSVVQGLGMTSAPTPAGLPV